MSNTPQQNGATLTVTKKIIEEAKDNKAIIALPAVKESWIEKNQLVSGLSRKEAEGNYEGEKISFTNKIAESKQLQECDKFTMYAAWIMHSISGLSFQNDEAYIVPYAGKAQWMPGWKGRLKQLHQRNNVKHVSEPQVVYDCDKDFTYQITDEGVSVPPFTPVFPRPEGARPVAVYMSIRFSDGEKQTFLMTAEEVHSIRDQFSSTYKSYAAALGKPENKDKKQGDKLVGKYYDKNSKQWKERDLEPPLALSNEAQYFRKTLVKRVYNNTAQGKSHAEKVIDERMLDALKQAPEIEHIDDSLESGLSDAFEIQDDGTFANTDTGEVFTEHEDVTDTEADTVDASKVDTSAVKDTFEGLD